MPSNADPLSTTQIGTIWDWDGIIIDSARQHEESWHLLAKEIDVPMTHDMFVESFGMKNTVIIPELFQWCAPDDTKRVAELGDRKESLYRDIVRRDGITSLPGVIDILSALKTEGVPCSVGSSTPRENIECIIDLAGLSGFFSAITAAEDVSRGKPDPEVFLVAAQKIDRDPAHCVVFEDAHVGIQAGLAAGMKTVAVATTHPEDSFPEAHLSIPSLTQINLPTLLALFGDSASD
ncbi:MAG: HAD family phosphatase [Verrucomicrobiota bacterium]